MLHRLHQTLSKNILHKNQTLTIINNITERLNSTEALKCWKCHSTNKSPQIFCEKCKIIQKPVNTNNHFKILGLKDEYKVNMKEISQKYRTLQSFLHPDKYSKKSKEEQEISEHYSSIVNRAYNTIQSPIKRAIHLLSLNGEQINENDKNTDQQFLMEIMELNEEVEEASTPEQLINLNKKNRKELEKITDALTKAFEANETLEAKNLIIRMKYYTSISQQINSILREKGITD